MGNNKKLNNYLERYEKSDIESFIME